MKFKRFIPQVFVLMLVVSWKTSVMAGSISLYEGEGGSQDLLGVLSDAYRSPKEGKDPGKISKDGKFIILDFQDKDVHLQDDEAKSAILKGVPPGTVISLCDDHDCDEKHDWAKIEIYKLQDEIVISHFEDHDGGKNESYEITFYDKGLPVNHLDGKVSAIKIPLLSYYVSPPSTHKISEELRQENPGTAIFLDAERIVANIKDTAYSHTTNVDDDAGRYQLDCSGLLNYILGTSLPLTEHYAGMLAKAKDKEHGPLAGTIYDYFSGITHTGWENIKYLRDTNPGDVIVEKYNDKQSSGSTGHVMIVAGWGEKLGKGNCKKESCWEYRVPIIESARGSLAYDTRDLGFYNVWPATSTRYIGKNKTGIGKGFTYFMVNQEGNIICHQRNKESELDCDGSYVIGRVVPLQAQQ
ncbi:MAG: hypothetical protein ACYC6S_12705 [Desulfobulbia bacterium]